MLTHRLECGGVVHQYYGLKYLRRWLRPTFLNFESESECNSMQLVEEDVSVCLRQCVTYYHFAGN